MGSHSTPSTTFCRPETVTFGWPRQKAQSGLILCNFNHWTPRAFQTFTPRLRLLSWKEAMGQFGLRFTVPVEVLSGMLTDRFACTAAHRGWQTVSSPGWRKIGWGSSGSERKMDYLSVEMGSSFNILLASKLAERSRV